MNGKIIGRYLPFVFVLASCGTVQYVEVASVPTPECPSSGFHTFKRADNGEIDSRFCAIAQGQTVGPAAPISIFQNYPPAWFIPVVPVQVIR